MPTRRCGGTGRDGSYADGTSKLMSSKKLSSSSLSRSHPSGLGPQVSGLSVQGTALQGPMAHPPPASRVIESPVWLAKLFCAPFGLGRLLSLLPWTAGRWIAGSLVTCFSPSLVHRLCASQTGGAASVLIEQYEGGRGAGNQVRVDYV